jgi:uncharacterized protein YbjT (DUF2867 family)
MRVLIFGGTGMVGSGVLMEALEREEVTSVVTVGRRSTGRSHPKLEEIVHDDFFDYAPVRDRLGGFDACFFCLGVSASGMTEEEYHRLTYDLTLAAAETLAELNPQMIFCYVSGSGADSSESGRWMWARVRGKIENKLLDMSFKAAHVFRPAFIQPMKGVRSRTRLYALMYGLLGPFYPVLRRIFPRYVTDSVTVGRAMIRVAGQGHSKAILENWDINAVGAEGG